MPTRSTATRSSPGDADVLVPAALEDAITDGERQGRAGRGSIVEAANGPTTPEADARSSTSAASTVIPDILANAGGVTVSYFEWAQNIQQFRWEIDRVVDELEKVMVKAYADVHDEAERLGVDLRTAAFALGIRRVLQAATSRNALRHSIDIN